MDTSRDDHGFVITSAGVFTVRKQTYRSRSLIDAICDSWTPPEEIELSPPTPTGLEGRMSDLLRMKDSVDSAIAEISPGRTDQCPMKTNGQAVASSSSFAHGNK